jgi:hypothetical protein
MKEVVYAGDITDFFDLKRDRLCIASKGESLLTTHDMPQLTLTT